MKKIFKWIPSVYFKGMAMGAADLIPGVSGGTIALIAGIYERLVNAIGNVDKQAVKYLLQGDFKKFWQHIDGIFLVNLILGILSSVFLFSKLIHWLLKNYPIPLWSFFFGLILASGFFVFRQIRQKNLPVYLSVAAGIFIAWKIATLIPAEAPATPLYLFFSGFLASIAMILPGISGSFILVLLGSYNYILESVHEMRVGVLLIMAAGVVTGLLSFAKFLKWLFRHHHDMTMGLLAGFLFGSLYKIWPWKKIIDSVIVKGKEIILKAENVWPWNYEGTNMLLLAVLMMLAGWFVLLLLEKTGDKISGQKL